MPGRGKHRIPRVDHILAAAKVAKLRGTTLAEEVGRVVWKMIELAQHGDTAAAKIVLDRLAIRDDEHPAGAQIVIVTGVPAREGTSVHVETPPHVLADVSECETVEDAAKANLKAMGYGPDGRPLQDRAPRLLP